VPSSCQTGLACIPNDAQTTGSCQVPLQLGDPCQTAFQCGGLVSTTYCNESSGTCVARPAAGTSCASPGNLCDVTSSWCNTTSSAPTCQAYVAAGGSCTSNRQCGPPWLGNTCVPTDGGPSVCVAATPEPSCSP
jgi:hypothetical protein